MKLAQASLSVIISTARHCFGKISQFINLRNGRQDCASKEESDFVLCH